MAKQRGMPSNPLTLRRFRTESWQVPAGSSGWVHIGPSMGKGLFVSEATKTGRFWPARYDPKTDSWVARGGGKQYKDGVITERFPLKRKASMGKRRRVRM